MNPRTKKNRNNRTKKNKNLRKNGGKHSSSAKSNSGKHSSSAKKSKSAKSNSARSTSSNKHEEICVICHEGFKTDKKNRVKINDVRAMTDIFTGVNCPHVFHTSCIKQWCKEFDCTCPLCKQFLFHDPSVVTRPKSNVTTPDYLSPVDENSDLGIISRTPSSIASSDWYGTNLNQPQNRHTLNVSGRDLSPNFDELRLSDLMGSDRSDRSNQL
ncbi:MAG: hypothetical protein CMC04_05025 [Flavobacteriaceae bacterium]|nr:hypothetical protein [Flavobacteriaceae bacterium]